MSNEWNITLEEFCSLIGSCAKLIIFKLDQPCLNRVLTWLNTSNSVSELGTFVLDTHNPIARSRYPLRALLIWVILSYSSPVQSSRQPQTRDGYNAGYRYRKLTKDREQALTSISSIHIQELQARVHYSTTKNNVIYQSELNRHTTLVK